MPVGVIILAALVVATIQVVYLLRYKHPMFGRMIIINVAALLLFVLLLWLTRLPRYRIVLFTIFSLYFAFMAIRYWTREPIYALACAGLSLFGTIRTVQRFRSAHEGRREKVDEAQSGRAPPAQKS